MATLVAVRSGGLHRTTQLAEGESWLAAARRVAGPGEADPVAVDLSGEVKEFVVDVTTAVTLRPATRGDLPHLARWRAQPHVQRWWSDDGEPTLDEVTRRYAPDIDGGTSTNLWIVEVNGRSDRFLQDYLLRDHPDYAVLTPDPQAAGCDYAIGEPAFVGRGLGVRALWAWVVAARERWPDVATYFAAPDHRNAASLRALERVGFVAGAWFDEPRRDGGTDTVIGCTFEVETVLG